jgi:antitoxin ParD1/3/4
MPEIQKVSIALTAEQVQSLQSAVESGEYATTSEAIREALREWQKKRELHAEEVRRLRVAWRAGKASGKAGAVDFASVRDEAKRRTKKARRTA